MHSLNTLTLVSQDTISQKRGQKCKCVAFSNKDAATKRDIKKYFEALDAFEWKYKSVRSVLWTSCFSRNLWGYPFFFFFCKCMYAMEWYIVSFGRNVIGSVSWNTVPQGHVVTKTCSQCHVLRLHVRMYYTGIQQLTQCDQSVDIHSQRLMCNSEKDSHCVSALASYEEQSGSHFTIPSDLKNMTRAENAQQ